MLHGVLSDFILMAGRKRQKEQKNLLRQMMIQKEEARIFAHASQIVKGELRKVTSSLVVSRGLPHYAA